MTWRPTTAALAGLCLALSTTTFATGATAAPTATSRAAYVSANDAVPALAGPPGAPSGVCPTGAQYGPPLPASSVTATKIQSGFSFLEGPVWSPTAATCWCPTWPRHRAVQRPAVHDPPAHATGDLRHVHRQRRQQRPGAQRRRAADRRGHPRPAERLRVPVERPDA
ncbi:hypothetical protein NKG94_15415 [Micromonospora sp. M12]